MSEELAVPPRRTFANASGRRAIQKWKNPSSALRLKERAWPWSIHPWCKEDKNRREKSFEEDTAGEISREAGALRPFVERPSRDRDRPSVAVRDTKHQAKIASAGETPVLTIGSETNHRRNGLNSLKSRSGSVWFPFPFLACVGV